MSNDIVVLKQQLAIAIAALQSQALEHDDCGAHPTYNADCAQDALDEMASLGPLIADEEEVSGRE